MKLNGINEYCKNIYIMAREDNLVTNNGMVASQEQMLRFVAYLKELVNGLTEKMEEAKKAVDKMEGAGYVDNTYKAYRELFLNEVKFINEMNIVLNKSGDHYEQLAAFVERHNKHIMESVYGSDLKI